MATRNRKPGTMNGEELQPLVEIQAPGGFETIDDSFGEEWEPKPGDMLTGVVVGGIRSFVANRGRPDEHIWRACNIADDASETVFTVKESASLRAWFDKLEEGVHVYIAFRGFQDVGKASPMKVFQAGIASANAPRTGASGNNSRVLRR